MICPLVQSNGRRSINKSHHCSLVVLYKAHHALTEIQTGPTPALPNFYTGSSQDQTRAEPRQNQGKTKAKPRQNQAETRRKPGEKQVKANLSELYINCIIVFDNYLISYYEKIHRKRQKRQNATKATKTSNRANCANCAKNDSWFGIRSSLHLILYCNCTSPANVSTRRSESGMNRFITDVKG